MTAIVTMIHDRSSQLMDQLIAALSKGKLCIVDVSQLRGSQSLILSGLILRRIFDRNQEEFTKAEPRTIPTIAVVEEAQSVLNERSSAAEPYIAWVKEGRKYDLGAVLITQQPGSISHEILSQGDNWFIFHLLSAGDLVSVSKANAHFSEDILSSLLNEPIPGQGVFWSSASDTPFPVAFRALSFERMYQRRDEHYQLGAVQTFASELRDTFDRLLSAPVQEPQNVNTPSAHGAEIDDHEPSSEEDAPPVIDRQKVIRERAIAGALSDADLLRRITNAGIPWGGVKACLLKFLDENLADRDDEAYRLSKDVVQKLAEREGKDPESFDGASGKRWVKLVPKSGT